MGLAHRIIPVVLCRGRTLVKGSRFDNARSVGVAAQAMRIHSSREVDECCLLDITATKEGRGPNLDLVRELVDTGFFSPLSVGGGVRSVEDVRDLLRAGADKVVVGTAAIRASGHAFIRQCRDTVGSQAIVVSIDVKGGEVWTRCGTVRGDGVGLAEGPVLAAERMANAGAGEILLQSIDRDGTMQGYDLEPLRAVLGAVNIPVIASGGCGTYEHMREALDAGASAVAAGAMFQFTDLTPKGAAQYLARKGIEVRL